MPNQDQGQSAYTRAGVDINAGNRAVEMMKAAVQSTYNPRVLGGIGAFGGSFSIRDILPGGDPVLVTSTDGVGTKVLLAAQDGQYAGIGHDIVNHCINDILVQGARPLFFLDYIASSHLDPTMVAEIVTGMAAACRAADCALIGGETAEMPGVYTPGHFDVAGTIVGLVERTHILPRSDIRVGDLLLGLASSGPHTNGYSLLRRVYAGVPLDYVYPELGIPLADALLAPHRNYQPLLQTALETGKVKALAHITGGGLLENIPRILPAGCGASLNANSWPVPALFKLTQTLGEISAQEMYRVFNLGLGMVVVIAPADLETVRATLPETAWLIGQVTEQPGVQVHPHD